MSDAPHRDEIAALIAEQSDGEYKLLPCGHGAHHRAFDGGCQICNWQKTRTREPDAIDRLITAGLEVKRERDQLRLEVGELRAALRHLLGDADQYGMHDSSYSGSLIKARAILAKHDTQS